MSVSVYYPYYNVYAFLDTPRSMLTLCSGIQATMGNRGIARNQVIRPTKKTWLDIPNQGYMHPDKTAGH